MNNPSTDLLNLFLNKFPECNVIITSDEFKTKFVNDRSLKTFLLLNSYNEQLFRKTDTDLFFKNLNTEKVSIAHITNSKMSNSPSIEFAPYYEYCYTTLNSEHSNEAIAFSICNSHFTCVRLNEMGLFIEKYFEKWFIETEFYDIKAIKNIFSKRYSLYDNNKIIYKLLDDLKSSVEDLSINMKKNYNLVPDMIIEYGGAICGANTYAVFKKNNLILDRGMVSIGNYEFYAEYLNFMKDQNYYDDKKNSLTRIRNKHKVNYVD